MLLFALYPNVNIQFKDKNIVLIVTGKKERCEAALSEINSIISMYSTSWMRKWPNAISEAYWKKEDLDVRRAGDAKYR